MAAEYDNREGGQAVIDPRAAEWERTYAMWIHLAGLIGAITGAFSVGLSLFVVLILWLVKRDQSPFVDDHGREAVNFHLSLLIYTIVVVPIAAFVTCVGAIIVVPILVLAIMVVALVGTIMGASAANSGRYYRYPATIRLLRG